MRLTTRVKTTTPLRPPPTASRANRIETGKWPRCAPCRHVTVVSSSAKPLASSPRTTPSSPPISYNPVIPHPLANSPRTTPSCHSIRSIIYLVPPRYPIQSARQFTSYLPITPSNPLTSTSYYSAILSNLLASSPRTTSYHYVPPRYHWHSQLKFVKYISSCMFVCRCVCLFVVVYQMVGSDWSTPYHEDYPVGCSSICFVHDFNLI